IRTPKFANEAHSDPDPVLMEDASPEYMPIPNGATAGIAISARRNRTVFMPQGSLEMILGSFMIASFPIAITQPFTAASSPFIALFAVGFVGIGWPALRPSLFSK
ncbi:MAG TPA: hypothetical protein VG711_05675, partial [Phycisphaerales bacterium]|nr:hypothetical protein [Phycisphaerales bacterium]